MNFLDLQVHSTVSDGRHAPRDVVLMARDAGIATLSLTDHDAVAGIDEAAAVAQEVGIRLIPGIEFSVEDRGAHILGYGIDYKRSALLGVLEESQRTRKDAARETVENLKRAGFAMEWEDVLREAGGASVIARPHLARAALNRPENREKLKGVGTVHDFIQAYLTDENPNYVKRRAISAHDAIALIHRIGGAAVWSHPAVHFRDGGAGLDSEALERFLCQLLDSGLDGIEVFSAAHAEDDVEYLESLASKYGIARAAGSDFHEKNENPPDAQGLHSARFPGDYETYGFPADDIVLRLEQAMEKRKHIPR